MKIKDLKVFYGRYVDKIIEESVDEVFTVNEIADKLEEMGVDYTRSNLLKYCNSNLPKLSRGKGPHSLYGNKEALAKARKVLSI